MNSIGRSAFGVALLAWPGHPCFSGPWSKISAIIKLMEWVWGNQQTWVLLLFNYQLFQKTQAHTQPLVHSLIDNKMWEKTYAYASDNG